MCCSRYIHKDIDINVHMENELAVLAEIFGMAVTHFQLPTTKLEGWLIKETIGIRTRSFGAAPRNHALQLVCTCLKCLCSQAPSNSLMQDLAQIIRW